MGFSIHPEEEKDIKDHVDVELEAFRSHPRIFIIWRNGYEPDVYAYYEANKLKGIRSEDSIFMKAVDDETGKIIAVAEWDLVLDPAKLDGEKDVDLKAPPPDNWPAGGNWEMRLFYKKNLLEWKRKHLTGRKYLHLEILVTHPDFHRRGAGAQLLAWGCEKADREGLLMCLEATPTGLSLYRRFGFVDTEVIAASMKQFGHAEDLDPDASKRVWMMREPRPQV